MSILNNLKVTRAAYDELPLVQNIVFRCGEQVLARHGTRVWLPEIPLDILRRQSLDRSFWLVWYENLPVATLSTSVTCPDYCAGDSFDDTRPGIYIGKLAVLPDWQSRGIGSWCRIWAEAFAREGKFGWLRLDVLIEHPDVVQWYVDRGFGRIGEAVVADWQERRWNLVLLEKSVNDGRDI